MKKILALAMMLVMLFSCMSFASAEEAKPVILVVSFGTSFNDNRALTIDALEADIQAAFPDYEVRRAFTAQTIIDILGERDALDIDNVTEAMDRLVADGVKKVVIAPTHVMNGAEYDDVMAEIAPYAGQFEVMAVGSALLTHAEDYETVIEALLAENENAGSADTALVYMGHGTHHFANAAYSQVEGMMHAAGYENAFVGTVEGFPTLEVVMSQVAASGASKVVLYPFMVVAGDHANNDMAGDEEDSWKSAFTAAGYEVECVVEGLAQNAAIRALYIDHIQAAIEEAGL
ncbi:MAG: sirohydrochlorin cobaltochelatase [Clostridia bacterium]|nr:sirohydrochlorin cobaltochelatase [Clostridia bacterium]